MVAPHPALDFVAQYIHILGWPALLGIAWAFRGRLDKFVHKFDGIDTRTKNTEDVLSVIQTNHLAHLAQDMTEQKNKQGETLTALGAQTAILASIDKGIGILVDRDRRA
jgi:hypothetical protein